MALKFKGSLGWSLMPMPYLFSTIFLLQGPTPAREQPENEDPRAYLWEQRPSTSDGRGMERVNVSGLQKEEKKVVQNGFLEKTGPTGWPAHRGIKQTIPNAGTLSSFHVHSFAT